MSQPVPDTKNRRFTAFATMGVTGILLIVTVLSCAKWKDPAPQDDPRLTNPYCNNPEAINYNWGFPGKPDSTVCIFPSDAFVGTYLYTDSVYSSSGIFDSALSTLHYVLHFYALDRQKLGLVGWCGNTSDTVHLTADRYYKATVDTAVNFYNGQFFCRTLDTVSGNLYQKYQGNDSFLVFNFTVVSDTDITTHQGTAVKQ